MLLNFTLYLMIPKTYIYLWNYVAREIFINICRKEEKFQKYKLVNLSNRPVKLLTSCILITLFIVI